MDRKYDVITLGEILLRLSTPINGRLAQGDTLMKHLGGAELLQKLFSGILLFHISLILLPR